MAGWRRKVKCLPPAPCSVASLCNCWCAGLTRPHCCLRRAIDWLRGAGPNDARIGENNAEQMIDFDSAPKCREVHRLDGTQCIFLSLRGINMWEKNGGMVGIRLWIGPNRLITVRRRFLKSVAYARDELQQEDKDGARTVGEVVARILVHLMHFFRQPLKEFEDTIASLEERVLQDGADLEQLRKELNEFRRRVLLLLRFVLPQNDALDQFVTVTQKSTFADIFDVDTQDTIRQAASPHAGYVATLQNLSQRAALVQGELVQIRSEQAAMLQDKLNNTLYMLTIISACTIPSSFILGAIGTTPEEGDGEWTRVGWTASVLAMVTLLTVVVFPLVNAVLQKERRLAEWRLADSSK